MEKWWWKSLFVVVGGVVVVFQIKRKSNFEKTWNASRENKSMFAKCTYIYVGNPERLELRRFSACQHFSATRPNIKSKNLYYMDPLGMTVDSDFSTQSNIFCKTCMVSQRLFCFIAFTAIFQHAVPLFISFFFFFIRSPWQCEGSWFVLDHSNGHLWPSLRPPHGHR